MPAGVSADALSHEDYLNGPGAFASPSARLLRASFSFALLPPILSPRRLGDHQVRRGWHLRLLLRAPPGADQTRNRPRSCLPHSRLTPTLLSSVVPLTGRGHGRQGDRELSVSRCPEQQPFAPAGNEGADVNCDRGQAAASAQRALRCHLSCDDCAANPLRRRRRCTCAGETSLGRAHGLSRRNRTSVSKGSQSPGRQLIPSAPPSRGRTAEQRPFSGEVLLRKLPVHQLRRAARRVRGERGGGGGRRGGGGGRRGGGCRLAAARARSAPRSRLPPSLLPSFPRLLQEHLHEIRAAVLVVQV